MNEWMTSAPMISIVQSTKNASFKFFLNYKLYYKLLLLFLIIIIIIINYHYY